MTSWTIHGCAIAALLLATGSGLAQSPAGKTRGQLLYDNHCVACHDKQVHWRDAHVATDWARLVAQVRRWQAVAQLQWSEEDILQVARHLNATIYRYPVDALAQRE